MENIKIDLSEFSLEEILDAIKKVCENDDKDSLYIKRSDLNLYIKNPNQKEVLNLLSSLLK